MDRFIECIIRRVVDAARKKDRDHLAQTVLAVKAVCDARPDMTTRDALAAVNMVRRT